MLIGENLNHKTTNVDVKMRILTCCHDFMNRGTRNYEQRKFHFGIRFESGVFEHRRRRRVNETWLLCKRGPGQQVSQCQGKAWLIMAEKRQQSSTWW